MFMGSKLSIVNTSILYKLIRGSSANLAKILEDKMTQKCIWRCKGPHIAKVVLKKDKGQMSYTT